MSQRQKYTVGIVANTTWNIYNFRMNIIRKLLSEGLNVVVFSPVDEYIQYKKRFPTVVHVPIKRLDRNSTNPIKDILLTLELIRKYRIHKPDLVVHYTVKPNIYGAIAARINRIPSIGIVTGLGFAFLHKGMVNAITKILYKISCHLHKKTIFENVDDRALFIDAGLISKEKAISIKGCGVDTDYFKPMPNGLFPDKTIFTFIGRLLYDKGVKEFVEAAEMMKAKHSQTEFWIVGEIDHKNPASVEEEDLIRWVREESIIYHGSTKDVRSFISHSDCIVLPSYREAIARSITEGMAMERPIIATDVAGCREAVEEGKNGFLVPPKNVDALVIAMERFIELKKEVRLQMGKYGRNKTIVEFDDKIIAAEVFKILWSELPLSPSHS